MPEDMVPAKAVPSDAAPGEPDTAVSGGRSAQLKHTGLRPGWTTGACATAATTAAYTALLTGDFPDPVTITLPRGQTPAFALAAEELTDGRAMAGIVKDAGDDPDVTHGALVRVTVRKLPPGAGVVVPGRSRCGHRNQTGTAARCRRTCRQPGAAQADAGTRGQGGGPARR